jgi:hypothetical protein
MTLQERCRDVGVEIEHRNRLRRDEKEAEAFRQRLQDLRTIRVDVGLQFEKVKTLRSKGVSVAKTVSQSLALTVLTEWEKCFIADPAETIKDYSRLKRSIEKVCKDVTQAVQSALDAVDRDLPTIDESFLRQVEAIPSFAVQVARIRERRDVLKGKDLHSMSANELEQFLGRRDDLRKLADQLDPKEFPKDVLDFFKATRRGGASLDQFTDSVQKWLADRNQLKNVRIIVAQS